MGDIKWKRRWGRPQYLWARTAGNCVLHFTFPEVPLGETGKAERVLERTIERFWSENSMMRICALFPEEDGRYHDIEDLRIFGLEER